MPASGEAHEARTGYSSAVRTNQARATRRAIVAAAGELFVEQGYAATTIDAVAERAGVGRKTVFSSIGGKGALLKQVWDWTLAGDDEPVPMAERPAVQAMLVQRDPAELVRMWAETLVDVGARAAPVGAVVFAAADVDAEVRTLREAIRQESLAGANAFAARLAAIGGLRPDLSIERAADLCWALINSLLLNLLVDLRGWSVAEYRDWLAGVLAASLLAPDAGSRREPAVQVAHHGDERRYVASAGAAIAGHLSYRRAERLVVLTHTEVRPEFEHLGVADALARQAFDDAETQGLRVIAVCPYQSWWLGRHPRYAALRHDPATE